MIWYNNSMSHVQTWFVNRYSRDCLDLGYCLIEISSWFFSVKITFKFFHWVQYTFLWLTIYRNITILSDAKVEDMSISYEAKVFLTVYYVTLATIGIPGNILTCVFSVEKSSRKMSATNCFLLNLSIVDLLNLSLGETFS